MGLHEQKPKEPIRDPHWKFKSGKYAGVEIFEVMCCDPGYIKYLMAHTDFDVHVDLFEDVEARYQQGMKILFARREQEEKTKPWYAGEVMDDFDDC